MSEQTHVLSLIEGRAGWLRLNRPRSIHALTLGMVRAMTAALVAWRDDPVVAIVLIDHAASPDGDPKLSRGFCAGGDVVGIAKSVADGGEAGRTFFAEEYRLNHLLHEYPKPTVAFMDGITMGGGVGLAGPCRYRVATERTLFAMPETGIGLLPDVGAGRYLSRLRGRVGPFLALTGARLDGAECLALGLATHFLPSDRLARVKAALAERPAEAEAILAEAAVPPPPARIVGNHDAIDRLFASDRLEDILDALAADGSDWAAKELATLRAKSPFSCKVSLRLLAESAALEDFADEMRLEYAAVSRVFRRHDFVEGVRALLIDKDGKPGWQPATAEAVDDEAVDEVFRPLPDGEAWQPVAI